MIINKLDEKGHTIDSLRAAVVNREISTLNTLDDLIRQHMNTVRHFQKSLESIELKPRILRQLDLQIKSMA